MRLAMYQRDGDGTAAVVHRRGDGDFLVEASVVLAEAGVTSGPGTVTELIADWPSLLPRLRDVALDTLAATPLTGARLLPPTGPGQLIVCCGFTYPAHEAEVGGSSVGATWFIKNGNSAIASGDRIVIPPDNPKMIDYEGELAVVIGRSCHRVSASEALSYVGGYTLVNDVSARLLPGQGADSPDDIRRSVIDSHLGKQYPTFCPIGPAVLTSDEITDPTTLSFATWVNGSVMQRADLSDMRMGVAELIAWLSSVFAFRPGDVISTGSPSGTGVSQRPPRFLGPADVVTVACDAIGELTNTVTADALIPA
jgi:2-keto-4-pentenoate hydratase/2-oxohepta-3-ene-1,7-dioic acid hydratase in catechol pathway